jgi:polyisoprenyl-phosphate glycosyltransferase
MCCTGYTESQLKLSIVIPVFNEGAALPLLLAELRAALTKLSCEYEILFVNDGSRDDSLAILSREAASDGHVKVLSLSRNFGQQAAITAGIDFCTGDAVIVMDADLQDPPELIPEMLRLYEAGYDVVSPQRISRPGDSWMKRKSAALFYELMRRLTDERVPPEVGDFRLLSRAAITALGHLREQHRFVRGMIGWLGLREALLPFHRRPRVAGSTKYGLIGMLRLSSNAITSFSALPLRLSTFGGLFAIVVAFLYFLWACYSAFIKKDVVQGWTSIVFLQCFFFGVTLLSIGLMGQYVARIYDESKGRPLYVLSHALNLNCEGVRVDRAMILTPREGVQQP